MKLAIISHTEHYKSKDGTIVGWSPTVNEINHLLAVFDTIYHVAMFYDGEAPASTMAYVDDRVVFVPIKPSGGLTFMSKLRSIMQAPEVIRTVSKTLKQVDCFQLRTPTGMGVYLIPYLTWFSNKQGWYKYAGNWNQKQAPLGYALQRWMLKRQSRNVTINGAWPGQPEHCLTFENPCLTLDDLDLGKRVRSQKVFDKFSFCYVGRLETEKGVERIIQAFTNLSVIEKKKVTVVHLVGSGEELSYFEQLSKASGVNIIFHGFLSREEVFAIYKQSHVFLMPTTASEGFPKVIAEAMNFGCVPVVSNVSSISQYISDINGYLLDPVTTENLLKQLRNILQINVEEYDCLINNAELLVDKFSFDHYNERIKNLIKNI